jgi:hypothetical protein
MVLPHLNEPPTSNGGFYFINMVMKSFKTLLIEANLQRRIFAEKPMLTSGTSNPVYNQIVTRPNAKPFDSSKMDEFKKSKQEYQNSKQSNLPTEDDGAWHYHFANKAQISDTKKNSKSNQNGYTFKKYYSVEGVENPETIDKFAKAIPDLHSRMDSLGKHFGQGFSFKIPSDPHTLATHTDSIVLHHYDMPDSSFVRSAHATIQKWATDNGISFLDRQGTDDGVDHHERGSFSQQLADHINNGGKGSLSTIGKTIVDKAVQHINSIS